MDDAQAYPGELTAKELAGAILWPVRDFYLALDDFLPSSLAEALALTFGRKLLDEALDTAFLARVSHEEG